MVDRERLERDTKRLHTRLRFAGLRVQATPEDVDYRAARGLDRAVFQKLTGGEWIERHENLLVTGPTGTGKTWLSCALGHRACRDNRSVLYHRVPRLLENLGLARGDGRYARMLKSLARVQVLILDDWGITPLTAEQRRDLLEIVDDRHGRASTVVISQLPVAHWHEHIGNPTIADAVLDRLVHTAHRIELRGESLRNCVPPKHPGLTRPLALEPNVAVLRPCHYPGWLPSECLAGFDRNRWLASSESAGTTSLILGPPEAQSEEWLRETSRHVPPRLSVSCFLLEFADGSKAMFDGGCGHAFGLVAGLAPKALASLGVKPEEITTILSSHAHPDHVVGLIETDGSARYPNAEMAITEVEHAYWMSDAQP